MFGELLPVRSPVELWEYWLGKQPIERGMHRSFRSMGEEFGQNPKPYLAGVIIIVYYEIPRRSIPFGSNPDDTLATAPVGSPLVSRSCATTKAIKRNCDSAVRRRKDASANQCPRRRLAGSFHLDLTQALVDLGARRSDVARRTICVQG